VKQFASDVTKRLSERVAQRATAMMEVTDLMVPVSKLPGPECFKQLHARVLRKITIETMWDFPVGLIDILDPSVFIFDDEGLVEIVSHNSKKAVFASADSKYVTSVAEGEMEGVVKHLVDLDKKWTSRNGVNSIQIRLDILPERVHDIAVVLSAHNSRDLSKFQSLNLRVLDTNSEVQLASYSMGHGGRAESMVCCTLNLLSDGLWHVHGSSSQCRGTLRDFRPVMEKLLALGLPRNVSMRSHVPVMLETLRQTLHLPRNLKVISADIGEANLLQVRFVHELRESESEPGQESKIADQLGERMVIDELARAIINTGDERFRPRHFKMQPSRHRPFKRLQVRYHWGYPEFEDVEDAPEDRECRFLDAACIVFAGRALLEVVDYRGPHGVRLVHNGVYDEAGVWLGPMHVGDATNAATKYISTDLDDLEKVGRQIFEIDLPSLPPTASDIFFVVSTPVFDDIGMYKDIKVTLHDAEIPNYEVLTVQMPTTGVSQEAGVICRIARMEGNYWRMGAFRASSPGSSPDYRPLLACLRNIQERTHGRASGCCPQRLNKIKKSDNVLGALGNWRKTAASRRQSVVSRVSESSSRRSSLAELGSFPTIARGPDRMKSFRSDEVPFITR